MTMNERQWIFTRDIAFLIEYAFRMGYRVRIAWAYRPRWAAKFLANMGLGIVDSKHTQYLAVDLDLFDKDGNYLSLTDDHLFLGEQWEKMGHTWGGRFSRPDGNHYEY